MFQDKSKTEIISNFLQYHISGSVINLKNSCEPFGVLDLPIFSCIQCVSQKVPCDALKRTFFKICKRHKGAGKVRESRLSHLL